LGVGRQKGRCKSQRRGKSILVGVKIPTNVKSRWKGKISTDGKDVIRAGKEKSRRRKKEMPGGILCGKRKWKHPEPRKKIKKKV